MDSSDEECMIIKRRRRACHFISCRIHERSVVTEERGLRMIRALGLEAFIFKTGLPTLNKALCEEFISSYSPEDESGMVCGQEVGISPESVHLVTGLPLGDRLDMPLCTIENIPLLREMIPCMKKSSTGYYLPEVRHGEDTAEFVAIARTLTEKLMCEADSEDYVHGAILLGLHISLRDGIQMPWAAYMARKMREAVTMTKGRNKMFGYGEWLTGLIESALSIQKVPLPVQPCPLVEMKEDIEEGEIMEDDGIVKNVVVAEAPVSAMGESSSQRAEDGPFLHSLMSREVVKLREELGKEKEKRSLLKLEWEQKLAEKEKEKQEMAMALKEKLEEFEALKKRWCQVEKGKEELVKVVRQKCADLELQLQKREEDVKIQRDFLALLEKSKSAPQKVYREYFDAYIALKKQHKQLKADASSYLKKSDLFGQGTSCS